MHRTVQAFALLLGFLAPMASGCGPDEIVELGCIEYVDPVHIEAPASALVGEPFLVAVGTYNCGCISFERTDAELTQDGADVYPYDREDLSCGPGGNLILKSFAHKVTLTFDTPGTKNIFVHGRRVEPGADDREITVTVATTVE
jgi:hypothetical protein